MTPMHAVVHGINGGPNANSIQINNCHLRGVLISNEQYYTQAVNYKWHTNKEYVLQSNKENNRKNIKKKNKN